MAGSLRLVGGSAVNCADGPCGALGRLVIDPSTRAVTHLAVESDLLNQTAGVEEIVGFRRMDAVERNDTGRLVSIDLVQSAGDSVRLDCSSAEFGELEGDAPSMAIPTSIRGGGLPFTHVTLHQIREGEVEVNGDESIVATDGRAGHL
jgi:hypothetical protein